jgi:hypothetical protein
VAVTLLVRFLSALPVPLMSCASDATAGDSGSSARDDIDVLRELENVAAVDDESVRSVLLAGIVMSALDGAARHLLEYLLRLQARLHALNARAHSSVDFARVFGSVLFQMPPAVASLSASTPVALPLVARMAAFLCDNCDVLFGSNGSEASASTGVGGPDEDDDEEAASERRRLALERGAHEQLMESTTGSLLVHAAARSRLVLRLLSPHYARVDREFAEVFMLTHDYFFTSVELALRLVDLYYRLVPPPPPVALPTAPPAARLLPPLADVAAPLSGSPARAASTGSVQQQQQQRPRWRDVSD